MHRFRLIPAVLIICTILSACISADKPEQTTQGGQMQMVVEYMEVDNMAGIEGDDPYVILHEGKYYYCWSGGKGIYVAELENMGTVVKDSGVLVYDRKPDQFYSIWAPELHFLNGKWYIYAAMCKDHDANELHRMYCLESDSPFGPFVLKGQVTDETNRWAIDGTVFFWENELYTIWSGWEGKTDGRQSLYIAHMSDPWTVDSQRVMISTPDSWDASTQNPCVNEGPCVVADGDRLYCLYSGNGSWTDLYSVGYLSFDGTDPMDPAAWTKCEKPILKRTGGFFGPGHCSVTQGADGSSWIIYHANLVSGTGWDGRSVRLQKLEFTENGISFVNQEKTVSIPVLREVK